MNRCTRCVMPDTVPGVALDENGLCDLCRSHEEITYAGREALDRLMTTAKEQAAARDCAYDCIVPISGGRDSSFVLYTAAVEYGMRVLAVNYNNEFRAPQAIKNIRTARDKTGADLAEISSKRGIAKKIVRGEIRNVMHRGLPAIIQVLCIACAYGYRSVTYLQALKYNVPLIIWGSSDVEKSEGIALRAFRKVMREAGTLESGSIGAKLGKLFNWNYLKLRWHHLQQRLEFHVPGNPLFADQPVQLNHPDIREISLFDYLEWDRQLIKDTIIGKLGWEKPPEHVSTWRTDCQLHELVNFCFVNPLGCTKACFGYSNMINAGQMTRDEALAQEQAVNGDFSKSLHDLLVDQIGLTEREVQKIASYQHTPATVAQ